jgi:lambda repressor-like predicted transcriptional regulator
MVENPSLLQDSQKIENLNSTMKCNFEEEWLRGENAIASKLFDSPVEIATNELYAPQPRRKIPDLHTEESRTYPTEHCYDAKTFCLYH